MRLCRTISQIRGWKICTPRGYTKFFPLFFLFGAEYFLLELSGSMQLALARPHYDTLCRVQAPPGSRTKILHQKTRAPDPSSRGDFWASPIYDFPRLTLTLHNQLILPKHDRTHFISPENQMLLIVLVPISSLVQPFLDETISLFIDCYHFGKNLILISIL